MPAIAMRYQHRHYKTLIVLVLSMTGGTFFLYWVGKLSPVMHIRPTPLRAESPAPQAWNQISVRTQTIGQPVGFYHWRIDPQGRLSSSDAWKSGIDPQADGSIQVVVATHSSNSGISSGQVKQLGLLLADLREVHHIPKDRIRATR